MVSCTNFVAIIGALLLVQLSQNVAGCNGVLDVHPVSDVKSVVDQLCDSSAGGISRISTITKLHDYFVANEQVACRDSYLEPLGELNAILETAKETGVCGARIAEQINKFHWDYIVAGLSKQWRKASKKSLPEPLKLFFMNYAQEVTETCKTTLMHRLSYVTGGAKIDTDQMYDTKYGFMINQMTNLLQPKDKIKKHGDFFLLNEQLVNKERKKGRSFDQWTDRETGDTILLSLKVKNPAPVWKIQQECRENLRPVYGETVLPVMRSIINGYGTQEKRDREDVAGSEMVKSWYAVTQMCQLILPINFYKNETIGKTQVVALPPDQARDLASPLESRANKESSTIKLDLLPIQLDDIVPNAASDLVVKLVKSNLKSRSRIYRHVIRNVLRIMKGQGKMLKNLFFSKKVGDKKYVIENGEQISKNPEVVQAENLLLEDDDETENKSGALVRNKRSPYASNFSSILWAVFALAVIGTIIFMIVAAATGL